MAMASIIEQAIQLELTAEKTYREAARTSSDPNATRILNLLADEEKGHAKSLRDKRLSQVADAPDIIQEARTWIRGVVEGGATAVSPDVDLLDVLRRAMTIEQRTESFYREHADSADDKPLRQVFADLADAERQHFLFVSSLVDYFNRPNEWVESAEFGQRDEY